MAVPPRGGGGPPFMVPDPTAQTRHTASFHQVALDSGNLASSHGLLALGIVQISSCG